MGAVLDGMASLGRMNRACLLGDPAGSSWRVPNSPDSTQHSLAWHMWDGFKLCVANKGFQGCFQLALMCKPYLLSSMALPQLKTVFLFFLL